VPPLFHAGVAGFVGARIDEPIFGCAKSGGDVIDSPGVIDGRGTPLNDGADDSAGIAGVLEITGAIGIEKEFGVAAGSDML
jgi:hypothetical protein